MKKYNGESCGCEACIGERRVLLKPKRTPKPSADRKDKIEQVIQQLSGRAESETESLVTCQRLCKELENMVHPEARMPRFNGLLRAIWAAATNEQS